MSQQKPFTYSCDPPGLKKCFIKGETLGCLRSDSSHAQTTFEENIKNWENRLIERGYPVPIVRKYPSELKLAGRKQPFNSATNVYVKKPLSFVTQYRLYLDWRKY